VRASVLSRPVQLGEPAAGVSLSQRAFQRWGRTCYCRSAEARTRFIEGFSPKRWDLGEIWVRKL